MAKPHECNPHALVTRSWSHGPPAEKDHPFVGVPCPDTHMVEGEPPGLYLVRGEFKGQRHHSLIAVSKGGELATHGGFELDHRAVYFTRLHLARYLAWIREHDLEGYRDFGLRLPFAAAPLRKRFEAGDPGSAHEDAQKRGLSLPFNSG